jgi:hypothetical protein
MPITRADVDRTKFNSARTLPYELRLRDFELAMQDVYDFFYDVNTNLTEKGLRRFEDMLEKRKATLSGFLSDFITASLATHSRTLTENQWPNGHPDLILKGHYKGDAVAAAHDGVEVKSTKKKGGAVDTHGGRDQWLCVFVYEIDTETEPAIDRRPLIFKSVYLGQVKESDFRKNARGPRGTRTATLHKDGITKLRQHWIYR